jgi:hypothetical protein
VAQNNIAIIGTTTSHTPARVRPVTNDVAKKLPAVCENNKAKNPSRQFTGFRDGVEFAESAISIQFCWLIVNGHGAAIVRR